MKDVGKISKCYIEHDNKGMGSSWFLDYVEIIDGEVTYHFAT